MAAADIVHLVGRHFLILHGVAEVESQADAETIYRILEEEILPLYYRVSEGGTPHDWVKIMKEAIRSTAATFSTRRMVKEYAEKFYVNALKEA